MPHRLLILLIFGSFMLFGAIPAGVPFAQAFENHTGSEPKSTCQTACHLPENIIKARGDKTRRKECASCHLGESNSRPPSPFQAPAAAIVPEDRHPNRRVLSARPPARAGQSASSALKAAPQSGTPPPKVAGMAYVPAGEFIMGSNERWDDEAPEHINKTGAFYIDLYEVTNEDYKKFVDATGREPPHHWPDGEIPKGKEKHPVVYVNWFDADAYCKWVGKRLPTEQEWEKAARGVDGLIYPWGNTWVLTKSNNPYKHSTGTEPVGSYPEGRSPYGLYDMSGNVWEWVDSYYLPHPGNTIPKGEYGTDKRVLKGGSWFDCLSYGCGLSAPTFNRSFFNPEVKNNSFGFRCARDP